MKTVREEIREVANHADEQIFKVITAVSTGAFALSVTYYINVYFTTFEVWAMVIGWICLVASVLSNVISYFYLRESANAFLEGSVMNTNEKEQLDVKVKFFDRLSIWGFFIGILIVSLAVIINVITHNVAEEHVDCYENMNEVQI